MTPHKITASYTGPSLGSNCRALLDHACTRRPLPRGDLAHERDRGEKPQGIRFTAEGIAETSVFASDEPCQGEAIRYATAKFNALQSMIS